MKTWTTLIIILVLGLSGCYSADTSLEEAAKNGQVSDDYSTLPGTYDTTGDTATTTSSDSTTLSVTDTWNPSGGDSSTSSSNPKYSFTVSSESSVTITLSPGGSYQYPVIYLQDSDGAELKRATGNSTATFSGTLSAGTYSIVCATQYSYTYDSFTLTVEGTYVSDLEAADSTAPSDLDISISGSYTQSSNSVSVTISGTDSVGISAYYLTETFSTPSSSDSGWTSLEETSTSLNTTVSFTASTSSGTKYIYLWLKDAAGNVSSYAYDSFYLSDGTAPSNVSISHSSGSTSSSTVSVTIKATDSIAIAAYYLSESSSTPYYYNSSWTSITETTSYEATVSYTFNSSSSGNKTIYVWFKDASNNVSSYSFVNITKN